MPDMLWGVVRRCDQSVDQVFGIFGCRVA
jgi:hypothetical protein